ncbi:MAG: ArsA-related P-loop ATPase [Deltaproteobacteria bacterium]|nr:ArsA-related P-loop ATPase [Deltaproteobacteria bacterium]
MMPQPSHRSAVLDRKLIVLSGKGGVGRTTVAAAMAYAAAARGKRVLVAETQGQGRLGRLLGAAAPLGTDVTRVTDRIDAVNMTPVAALREYGLMTLRIEALYKVVFENRPVRAFLAAVPGLYAYSMLGKAWWHTTEQVNGRPKYDLVILDAPASGHAVAMMKIPRALVTAMPKGPLTRDAQSIYNMLTSPTESAFVIVTLPEELPARETVELVNTTRHKLNAPLGPLIVNAVPDPSWAAEPIRLALSAAGKHSNNPQLQSTLDGVRALSSRRLEAEPILKRLAASTQLPLVSLPRLFTSDMGPAETKALAQLLDEAL